MKLFVEKKDDKFILDCIRKFFERAKQGKYQVWITRVRKKRTATQNNALHLYFTLLAEALNDAGFDIKKTIQEGIDIPWTARTIKEYLWRPAQKVYLQKESTTELNKTEDIDKIYDIVNRAISERCGVSVPFPTIEELEAKNYEI